MGSRRLKRHEIEKILAKKERLDLIEKIKNANRWSSTEEPFEWEKKGVKPRPIAYLR